MQVDLFEKASYWIQGIDMTGCFFHGSSVSTMDESSNNEQWHLISKQNNKSTNSGLLVWMMTNRGRQFYGGKPTFTTDKKHTTSNTSELKQPQCSVNVDSDSLSSQDDSLQIKGRHKNCMFLNFTTEM